MITGTVNATLEPCIRLPATDAGGQQQEIEAIIDTGFDGFLTLPAATIAALGCSRKGWNRLFLADGSQSLVPIYAATVIWDGQSLTVDVGATTPVALVGMALLRGYNLHVDVVDGGAVTITPLP